MSRPSSQMSETQDYFCSTPENIRQVRPFYWMLLLVLAVLYAVSLADSPALRAPLRFIPFTVLMLAHAGLHWIGPYLTTRRRWLFPYFILQGALVVAITWIAPSQRLLAGLYLALIAVATGVIEDVRLSAAVVTGYLALSAVNFAALRGWNAIPDWLIFVAPMAFFMMVYVTTFIRQAQARMRAVNLLSELEIAHRQLAEYADKVESLTLTTERQRMARELHDTLAQGLAGLILQLEALEGYLGQGDHATAALIATQARDRARAALSEARQAIDDLRLWPALTESLPEAIREEAQRFSSATGIPCAVTLPPNLALPAPTAEHALRCITEGLTNIARHARASHASVFITILDGSALIQVQDNGTGFDPSIVVEQAGHYGLLGLRERARLAGGTLEVKSASGAGTTLSLCLPMNNGGSPE
jgi:NarL family two-component system sensor histidine kinase YdfH